MDPSDREQTELLRLIWTEMKALGQNLGGRIDRTNERLDALRVELRGEIGALRTELKGEIGELRTELKGEIGQTNARLGVVEGHLRDLAGQQLILGRYVKRMADRHDGAIDELRERVTRIETRLDRER